MRKGIVLEHEIERMFKFLDSQGIHAHKNHAKRTHDGRYIEGEPFDYEVFSPSRVWTFDAKECSGDRWALSNAKPHQIDALMKTNGFFLVYFAKDKKLVSFSADLVKERLMNGIHRLAPDEGEAFDWQVLLK